MVNDYARKQDILKEKDANLTGDDIREGLTAIISVKLGDPQFEGQTKTKLGNSEMRPLVHERGHRWPCRVPRGEPQAGPQRIVDKAMQASKAREPRPARPAR